MLTKDNKIFVKEYEIPSCNYNENRMLGLWFISEIDMEIKIMMNQFDKKVFFKRYKDKYFFSNNEKKAQDKMLQEIENEILLEGYKKRIKEERNER